MNKFFSVILLAVILCVLPACMHQQMQRQVNQSRVVVLDIGHYYGPQGEGQGARTPDNKYGEIQELSFWYRNVIHTKQVIESAGYTCVIINRGALPGDRNLARFAKQAGIIQINTPVIGGVYRSKHHPKRMAVGMLSVNYALDCQPACVVFLHHNSNDSKWRADANSTAFYSNKCGTKMAEIMATQMNRHIMNKGMPNGGVRCGVVLRNDGRKGGGDWLNACNESYVPAVITEAAFLNNPEHAQYLRRPENAINFARNIGQGIINYLEQR